MYTSNNIVLFTIMIILSIIVAGDAPGGGPMDMGPPPQTFSMNGPGCEATGEPPEPEAASAPAPKPAKKGAKKGGKGKKAKK